MFRRTCWILLIVAALLVTGGCRTKNEGKEPTMTFEEADAQVEQLIREAATQLPPGAELTNGRFTDLACDDANGITTGKYFAERSYDVAHPKEWPTDQAVEILRRFWSDRGYRVSRNELDNPKVKAYFVKDRASGMAVGIELYPRQNGTTDMYITGESPCVQAPLDPPVRSPSP